MPKKGARKARTKGGVSIKELQDELDQKLAMLQKGVDDLLVHKESVVEGDELTMAQLQQLLRRRRLRVGAKELVEDSEATIRAHPILAVAGALTFGVLLGAVLAASYRGRRSQTHSSRSVRMDEIFSPW